MFLITGRICIHLEFKTDRLARAIIKLAINPALITVLTVRLPHNHMTARKGGVRGLKRRNRWLRLVKHNFCVDLVVGSRVRYRWRRGWRIEFQHLGDDIIITTFVGLPADDDLAIRHGRDFGDHLQAGWGIRDQEFAINLLATKVY